MRLKAITAAAIVAALAGTLGAGSAKAASPLSLEELVTCTATYGFFVMGATAADQGPLDHSAFLFREKVTKAAGSDAKAEDIDKKIFDQIEGFITKMHAEGADPKALYEEHQKVAKDCQDRYSAT